MKKRSLLIFLSIIFILSCLVLTACHEHEFGEWEVVLHASCTDSGLEERLCVCGEKETKEIDAKGHIDGDWIDIKQSTCSSQGSKNLLCANCDEILKTEDISPTGVHNFQESNICEGCSQNIADVAVDFEDMSATIDDDVKGYLVPRLDGLFDGYIKGSGAIKNYPHDAYPIFAYNYTIANVYIQDGVTQIGNNALHSCGILENIVIPNSVTRIGDNAFLGCESLVEIVIPSSVISIGSLAFQSCKKLANITIEGSPQIDYNAFYDTEFYKNSNNWQNMVLYIDNCLIEAEDQIQSCQIKDGTKVIAKLAFDNCNNLATIVIPHTVLNIGDRAFENCTSLAYITIEGCPQMGYLPFLNTAYSKNVTNWNNGLLYVDNCLIEASATIVTAKIKTGTVIIAGGVFYSPCLTTITIPESIRYIGPQAFELCLSLNDIYYTGSEMQWNDIIVSIWNETLTNATIHYNYTAEEANN